MTSARLWPGLIEAYRDRLPVSDGTPVITLYEGGTPLVRADGLSERTGCTVYLKVEGANPTGSFKDRGMTCAVSAAVREGARAVICASTGNTAASAAAYAARAGITCAVIVPEGKIARGFTNEVGRWVVADDGGNRVLAQTAKNEDNTEAGDRSHGCELDKQG